MSELRFIFLPFILKFVHLLPDRDNAFSNISCQQRLENNYSCIRKFLVPQDSSKKSILLNSSSVILFLQLHLIIVSNIIIKKYYVAVKLLIEVYLFVKCFFCNKESDQQHQYFEKNCFYNISYGNLSKTFSVKTTLQNKVIHLYFSIVIHNISSNIFISNCLVFCA